MKISVDRLSIEKLEEIVVLSSCIGWDYSLEEIETILNSGIVYGVWNERGELVASAAIILYGEKLASIGMVIVHPNYKGRGIGKMITEACIRRVSEKTPIMLIATEDGKPLYEKLGFQVVSHVSKYICNEYSKSPKYERNTEYIFNCEEKDLKEIAKIDEMAFGVNRRRFLKCRIKQSQQCVVAKDKENNVIGYGMSIQTPENRIIGPIVAPNDMMASSIVYYLAKECNGKLRIDVPEGKVAFMKELESFGFQKINQPPIMMKNSDRFLKRNGELYSIAAQIFG
ncbi:GNAT family N-acetyltransferase [Bacillus clarus]|uniref:Acetyltransferase family protein n=1 Tax=Bacillus clarus TaxID=2338372 RepID=A0A090YY24_9BACI|nr:GNAT family N-acetyltransferase [Bacillus clarus]KFN02865.1 acetyltransferase family protein [Bacillus clarus]RFT68451.1 GNAT family N-acetyltransferase [Bacillus clarus]